MKSKNLFALATSIVFTLTACSNSADTPTPVETLAIPSSWPSSLPLLPDTRVIEIERDDDTGLSLTFRTKGTPTNAMQTWVSLIQNAGWAWASSKFYEDSPAFGQDAEILVAWEKEFGSAEFSCNLNGGAVEVESTSGSESTESEVSIAVSCS